MIVRELTDTDKNAYIELANHPLQSWQWGDFRKSMGVGVVRVGVLDKNEMTAVFQFTLHKLPFVSYYIGYLPKSPLLNESVLRELSLIGKKHNCIFIQLEPNVMKSSDISHLPAGEAGQTSDYLKPSARAMFTKYTFQIDLTLSEDELQKNMTSKTRYNMRVAQKHGVEMTEENTPEAFERYIELTKETTQRQKFFAHNEHYHRQMWKLLSTHSELPQNVQPIAHLLTARYKGKILVTWIVFLFKDVLYYPYGASSTENRDVMASTLMMWETIRWGKKMGARLFDLWGTPGPDPKPSDPYFGFHRFKLGFGPKLVEFVGSYDLVLNHFLYQLFTFINNLRWFLLKRT